MVVANRREQEAFLAILDAAPLSLAGIAALTHVLWSLEGPVVSRAHPDFWKEAATPTSKILRAVWRAASGKEGLPPE